MRLIIFLGLFFSLATLIKNQEINVDLEHVFGQKEEKKTLKSVVIHQTIFWLVETASETVSY